MSNNVVGWTERTTRDPSTTSPWNGSESTSIYNNQGDKANGSVLTRDTPANKLGQFRFEFDADIYDTGNGGAIVFYVNDDGSEYYAITFRMEWSKTTFYLSKDNSTTGGGSTLVETFEVSTLNTSEGNQKVNIVLKVDSGLLTFNCVSLDNDQHANWQYSLTGVASGYTEGYAGWGAYDGWDSSRFTWYFKSLEEIIPQPTNTRPRFWIIS